MRIKHSCLVRCRYRNGFIVDLPRWTGDDPDQLVASELLDKLQAEKPGNYSEGLLRTVQRRLKGWRSEQARALVFSGTSALASEGMRRCC